MKTNEMIILTCLGAFILFILGIISIFIFSRKKDEDGNQDISARSLKMLYGGIFLIFGAFGVLYKVMNGMP